MTKVTLTKVPLADAELATMKPSRDVASKEQRQTKVLKDAPETTNQDPNAPTQEPVYVARSGPPAAPTTAKDIKLALADIADRLDRSRTLSATPDVAIAEAVKALRDIAGVDPA